MTIYSFDILLFLFGTILLFHIQFWLLLLDLHIGFSTGRSGGLVFLPWESHGQRKLAGYNPWNCKELETTELLTEYIMRNAGMDEAQTGIKIARRNINSLIHADDITLMAETEEELKSLLMKVKEESRKSWLKAQHSENKNHGIWSHHFMGNRWGNSGNSVRLYFGRLQNHCRWWLQPWNKKMLTPWKESDDQPR